MRTPEVGTDFLRRIREHREARGILVKDAAARAGLERSHYTHLERGNKGRPHFDTVHAVAAANGLRLDLVPDDTDAKDWTGWRRPARGGLATGWSRSIVAKLKAERERRGWTLRRTARAAGFTSPGSLHDTEAGRYDPRLGRVAALADALGMRIGLVADYHAPFLELSVGEAEQVRALIRWYRDRAPATQAARFGEIASKLERAAEPDTMDNAA